MCKIVSTLGIIIFTIIIEYAFGQGPTGTSDKPDITLLSRVTQDNRLNLTCVAGDNVHGSALTFITPLGGNYMTKTPVSEYRSTKGITYPPNAYDCDFESESGCTEQWTKSSDEINVSWVSAVSGQHTLPPVTDEHWESKYCAVCSSAPRVLIEFPTYFSSGGNITRYNFKQDLKSIGISVRTNGQANIFFCDYITTSYCYWIVLNEENSNNITLWNCYYLNIKNPKCTFVQSIKRKPWSEISWKHLKLSIFDQNILISDENNYQVLQSYTGRKLYINQISLQIGGNKKGVWKIHDYSYLILIPTAVQVWRKLGPKFQADDTGMVCVEFHVAAPSYSNFKFGFDPTPLTVEVQSQSIQRWEYVKLCTSNAQNITYQLQVSIDNYNQYYLLIDDVRRCHANETRVISTVAPLVNSDTISCQALTVLKWKSSIIGGRINKLLSDFTVCDNETYTGTNCAISCMSALGTDCSRLTVCEPSAEKRNSVCVCAAGYTGDQCQKVCEKGYYGSGCNKPCESCNDCSPSVGTCITSYEPVPGDINPESPGMNNSQNGFNPAFYSLLLLLLIPAIAWLVYRKMYKPKSRLSNITATYEAHSSKTNITFNNQPFIQNNLKVNNNLQNDLSSKNNIIDPPDVTVHLLAKHEIKDEKQSFSKLVKINNLSSYVKESLNNGELEKQFKALPKGETKPWNIGVSEVNAQKNRYKNLTAYDHSRVILKTVQGNPHADFINANYIHGYKKENAYIATQGPKKSTINDFWRMIWQEKVTCIVMITNLVEGGKVKCEKYWPDIEKFQEYDMVRVIFIEEDTYADFVYRTFKVLSGNVERRIHQYHFTSWPDHGVPLYPQSLVPFLTKILAVSPEKAPIVVHCSAGVGRTGTIILADICLRMAAKEGQIDVFKYFHSMREQRVNMVAEYDQYQLVHMALLECLLTPKSNYPCLGLSETVEELIEQDGIKEQLQYLKNTAWQNQAMGAYASEVDPNNASKNRFSNIVPSGRRIYLSKYTDDNDSSDYINAVPVDGFRIKNQFIVTQNPLPHTIKDFWRLILEFNCKVIVSLNEIKINDKTSNKFWPSDNEEITPLPYLTVKCQTMTNKDYYEHYKIKLEDTRNTGDNVVKSVNIIKFKNWNYEKLTPPDEEQIINTLEAVHKLPREDESIVVTCHDGARASGLFVALSFITEKIKLEQICDVYLAVKTVRSNREQFVTDSKQFEFLYNAAVKYVAKFDLYSNFDAPLPVPVALPPKK